MFDDHSVPTSFGIGGIDMISNYEEELWNFWVRPRERFLDPPSPPPPTINFIHDQFQQHSTKISIYLGLG